MSLIQFLSSIPVIFLMSNYIVFDFNKSSDITSWNVVVDGVMGGRSTGEFYVGPDGHGIFEGTVSLENNGGFSSIRYGMQKLEVKEFTKFVIRLKGDGKKYQFRVRDSYNNYYSYITLISTTDAWQNIEIPFSIMYPHYRGRDLNLANFNGDSIVEIGFLIGNKKNERFKLEIDNIILE